MIQFNFASLCFQISASSSQHFDSNPDFDSFSFLFYFSHTILTLKLKVLLSCTGYLSRIVSSTARLPPPFIIVTVIVTLIITVTLFLILVLLLRSFHYVCRRTPIRDWDSKGRVSSRHFSHHEYQEQQQQQQPKGKPSNRDENGHIAAASASEERKIKATSNFLSTCCY